MSGVFVTYFCIQGLFKTFFFLFPPLPPLKHFCLGRAETQRSHCCGEPAVWARWQVHPWKLLVQLVQDGLQMAPCLLSPAPCLCCWFSVDAQVSDWLNSQAELLILDVGILLWCNRPLEDPHPGGVFKKDLWTIEADQSSNLAEHGEWLKEHLKTSATQLALC